MYTQIAEHCIAFDGSKCIATGDVLRVARTVKMHTDANPQSSVLVFDTETSRIVEMDLRGSLEDVLLRIEERLAGAGMQAPIRAEATPKPGRPKLGVVAREVTLLPRHWEWLEKQPGGASVTLRKLVDAARKHGAEHERIRSAQEATYRFMNAMAGDYPGFQEALRALYANNRERFEKEIADWPRDIRLHTQYLAQRAMPQISKH